METSRIFDGILESQLGEVSGQTVGQVKRVIQEKARSTAEELRAVLGADVAQNIAQEAETWSRGVQYDESIQIDTIAASDGAAGMHHMGSRVTTLDVGALKNDRDAAYWKRVENHEAEHAKQAVGFSVDTIDLANGQAATLTDLLEWGAITASAQPESDLTTGYQEHRRRGEMVASVVGKEALMHGLHTGDLTSIQETVRERALHALAA